MGSAYGEPEGAPQASAERIATLTAKLVRQWADLFRTQLELHREVVDMTYARQRKMFEVLIAGLEGAKISDG